MKASEVKKLAKELGADLVGIAPIERLAGLPAESNPKSVMPSAKSVIVVGRRILRGAYRGIEEGTNFWSTYGCFGNGWLEGQFLARTVADLTSRLEEEGIEAVPMRGSSEKGENKKMAEAKPAANVCLDYKVMAQAAGLGSIGKGGFFITKEYGHRQRFAMIITDAEFEVDEVVRLDLCAGCSACADACPLKAMNKGKTSKAGLKDAGCDVFELNTNLCENCVNGRTESLSEKIDRSASSCGRACLVALENKIGNKFENKFRKRKVWTRDLYGKAHLED